LFQGNKVTLSRGNERSLLLSQGNKVTLSRGHARSVLPYYLHDILFVWKTRCMSSAQCHLITLRQQKTTFMSSAQCYLITLRQ
jgi:hypothetical protein